MPPSPTPEPGYEVGISRRVRALHHMPGKEGPEGTLHAHDYRVEVVVRRAATEGGMVLDLEMLEQVLDDLLGGLEGRDLEVIRPAEEVAVTVEILAAWVHAALLPRVGELGGEWLGVRVWESDSAFGGFSASLSPPRR